MFEKTVNMIGLEGHEKIEIPSNFQYLYKFITLINITDNSVCIYPPDFTTPTAGANIICAGSYSAITIPLIPELVLGFNIVYTNPTASNLTIAKKIKVIFSEENLNYNSSFAPSFTSGGDVVNTAFVADDVGLAKEIQLPAGLTSTGNLKVSLSEDNLSLAKAAQLPGALSGSGNLKISVQEIITEQTSWSSQTTTNDYADLGNSWVKPQIKTFTVNIKNTHATNSIKVKILASLDSLSWFEILTETEILPTENNIFDSVKYYPYVKIQVKSSLADTPGTVEAQAAGVGL